MNEYFKGVATQGTAILLAALAAGAITFFQSLAAQSGVCPAPVASPGQAGVLGAIFKTVHTAFTQIRPIA